MIFSSTISVDFHRRGMATVITRPGLFSRLFGAQGQERIATRGLYGWWYWDWKSRRVEPHIEAVIEREWKRQKPRPPSKTTLRSV
jgi:hypothetical protein